MKKLFALLATSMIALGTISAEDYTLWGYYMGGMDNQDLGIVGASVSTHRVAIFVPGNGLLAGGTIAGVNVPVYDATAVTALSAWVTPSLSSSETYAQHVELTNYANDYNQVIFPESYAIPESGCYVGYTITVNTSLNSYGSTYPIIYDPLTKMSNSFWIWYSSQDGWLDIGSDYGASCLQALVANLQLPEVGAHFGTIQNAITEVNTDSDWPVTVYSDASEAVSNIEYTIDINGVKETRVADVAIAPGLNQSGEITVSIASPAEAGAYDVVLAITKVNGKDNTQAENATVTTFNNLTRFVERNTLVEENTGTGCGYCPRGLQGMANLRAEFGDRFIGLAIHQFNSNDPMYPNYYIQYSNLGMSGAPSCTLDRKEVMDPYFGTQSDNSFILSDFERYCNMPAEVDIQLESDWVGENKDSVKIDVNVEALGGGSYDIVYVLIADSLTGSSAVWRQSNYYYQENYNASTIGPEDLAKFCKGGDYGTSRFVWAYDDVVLASSYNSMGRNQASRVGSLSAGESAENSYVLALPTKATLRTAVDASIDKVYAVVFVINADGTIAQAVKARVGQTNGSAIEEVANDNVKKSGVVYDLQGLQISAPRQGQLFILDGKKMIIR